MVIEVVMPVRHQSALYAAVLFRESEDTFSALGRNLDYST